ncbi:MAG: FkbM family methyltransferase, partial [Lachnospiraceae bacterium]|nr:FkbM family methyltransferase [Candidatus Colinaster scatohippi]
MQKEPKIITSEVELEEIKRLNPESNIFSHGAKYFDISNLTSADLEWIGKDYDAIYFDEKDAFLPELAFFFANMEYREKLSAKQMLEVISEETQAEDGSGRFEFEFIAIIERELKRGNEIVICPFGEAGQSFKQLLNSRFGIKEAFILDDGKAGEVTSDGIRILSFDELAEEDMFGRTVIVNEPDYEQNLVLAYKLSTLDKNIRTISPFGAYEILVPGRQSFIEKVRELTEVKRPITDCGYVRIGADRDGGYILLDDFAPEMAAYSFGINDDVTWDEQMADTYDMNIYMYDHTIDGLPKENPHFHYYKQGVAGCDRPEELLYSLKSCLEQNGHSDKDNLILKMDVEGAEWDVINETPSEILGQFRQIAFELHDFDHPEKERGILAAFKKLNDTHFPVWIHGNNHTSAMCTENITLPIALEILYLNKAYYKYEEGIVSFPWNLDNPNTSLFPEYILGNWGKRSVNATINNDECLGDEDMSSYDNVKNELLNDIDFVAALSDKLLGMMSIFGPKERVHLAPDAEMQNSVVNTMSGEVYVGSGSFCGHNVSIITGSHDAYSYGEARRQYPCDGNDIIIGEGVWICSNAVILGPCKIGDNSVVAAGSIVLPGTEIGAGELWAGVPAVYKKTIECNNESKQVQNGPTFDTIIVITPKDYMRVEANYKRLVKWLPSDRLIFVGNSEVGELVKKSNLGDKVGFICEDDILPFDEVNAIMYEHLKDWLNGREMPRGFT